MKKALILLMLFFRIPAFAEKTDTLNEIVSSLNPHLVSKIDLPRPEENNFYARMENLLPAKDKVKALELLRKLGQDKNLTCSAYVTGKLVSFTGFLDMAKEYNQEFVYDKSWAKGLQANRLWLKMTTCHAPLIYNAIGMALLEDAAKKLTSLSKVSMTAEEKAELQKLKRDISEYSVEKSTKASLKYEIIFFGSLMSADVKDGKLPVDLVYLKATELAKLSPLIEMIFPDKKVHFKWSNGAMLFAAVLNAMEDDKTNDDDLKGFAQRQLDKGFMSFITAAKLADKGIKSSADLVNETKISALVKDLNANGELLKKKRVLVSSFDGSALFVSAALPLVIGGRRPVMEKFEKRKKNIIAELGKI